MPDLKTISTILSVPLAIVGLVYALRRLIRWWRPFGSPRAYDSIGTNLCPIRFVQPLRMSAKRIRYWFSAPPELPVQFAGR